MNEAAPIHLLVRDGYLSTKIVIFGKNQAIYFIRVVCFLMIFLNMFSKLENKALEKSTPTSLTKAHPSLTKRCTILLNKSLFTTVPHHLVCLFRPPTSPVRRGTSMSLISDCTSTPYQSQYTMVRYFDINCKAKHNVKGGKTDNL